MVDPVISACIEWNENERRRARSDAKNDRVRVPASAKKPGHGGTEVPLTTEEYREQRAKDVMRFARNIATLKSRDAAPPKM